MGKKQKSENNTNVVSIPQPGYQRANYLYQAISLLRSKNKPALDRLAAFYSISLKQICEKSLVKLHPDFKRNLCKKCSRMLVAGRNCRIRFRRKRSRHMTVTCLSCGHVTRYLTDQMHKLSIEKTEESVEMKKE